MIFGRYNNKAANGDIIFLVMDDNSSKWYAENISKHTYTGLFTSIDSLRDSLRLNPEWKTLKEHIHEFVKLKHQNK